MVKNSRSENKIVNRKFKQKPAGLSKGFYIGLQVWMLFLVAFLSLGYRIALSVFFRGRRRFCSRLYKRLVAN